MSSTPSLSAAGRRRSPRPGHEHGRRFRSEPPPWSGLQPLEPRCLLSAAALDPACEPGGAAHAEAQPPLAPIDVNALVAAGGATISGSPFDIGNFALVFDANTTTLYRSRAVNPATIQVHFTRPQTFHEFRALFSHIPGATPPTSGWSRPPRTRRTWTCKAGRTPWSSTGRACPATPSRWPPSPSRWSPRW